MLSEAEFGCGRFLKLEIVWTLINLTYGNTECVMAVFAPEFNAVTVFSKMLASDDLQMIEQVLWLLANSAADSKKCAGFIAFNFDWVNIISRLGANADLKVQMQLAQFLNCILVYHEVLQNNQIDSIGHFLLTKLTNHKDFDLEFKEILACTICKAIEIKSMMDEIEKSKVFCRMLLEVLRSSKEHKVTFLKCLGQLLTSEK